MIETEPLRQMVELSDVTDGSTLEGRIERAGEIRRALDASDLSLTFKRVVDRYLEGILLGIYGLLNNPEFKDMLSSAHLFSEPSGHAYMAGQDWIVQAFGTHHTSETSDEKLR